MKNKTTVNYVDTRYIITDKNTTCFLTYEINTRKWPITRFKIDPKIIMKTANKLGALHCVVDKTTNYPEKVVFTTVGSATCDDTKDNYDINTGKRLALTRAQAKAFEKTCKLYDLLQIELDKTFNEMTSVIDNNWFAAEKCWEHAKTLGGY